jgi:ribosomal protein S12 methylthiotransferase
LKTRSHTNSVVNVITLGCSKNLVDSENLVTQLRANSINAKHEHEGEADTIIINTCGFIEAAKEESIDTILHYAVQKKSGLIEKLYVTGCLSQRYSKELSQEIPEVDAFFGTLDLPLLLARFNADYKHELVGEKISLTPPHYAYLKISEGCNRTCSFCSIPLMRGRHRSRSIEEIELEARNLVMNGVKEIILIAQELTYYGLDLYRKRMLCDLLKKLTDIESLEWIRLHYTYPSRFPREVIELIAQEEKICRYLDMPLQHADDAILKSMKRQTKVSEMIDLINFARDNVPDIALRTTMIVGFPGETETTFDRLCRFVEEVRFDRLGVFEYSHEEGTDAFGYEDDVSTELKAKRAEILMEIQKSISLEKNQKLIGKEMKVLVDRKEGDFYYGRTEFDSPEVDNEVLIDATTNYARVGDFVRTRIHDATEYDLYGDTKKSWVEGIS